MRIGCQVFREKNIHISHYSYFVVSIFENVESHVTEHGRWRIVDENFDYREGTVTICWFILCQRPSQGFFSLRAHGLSSEVMIVPKDDIFPSCSIWKASLMIQWKKAKKFINIVSSFRKLSNTILNSLDRSWTFQMFGVTATGIHFMQKTI